MIRHHIDRNKTAGSIGDVSADKSRWCKGLKFLAQLFKHRSIVHLGILYKLNEECAVADCIEQLDFADDRYTAVV